MKTEPVAAVTNAIHIVEMLADNDMQGVGEISKALSISKTTTHRLLQSLVDVNLVSQDEETQKYRLTYRLLSSVPKLSEIPVLSRQPTVQ